MATTKETQAQADSTAAEGQDGKEAAATGKSKFPIKLILIAVAGLVALGGIGGGGYYLFAGHSEAATSPVAGKVKPPVFLDLPEVLVNLSATGGDRTQYLKVKVVLELPDQQLTEQIQPLMPRLMDTFQTYLRELRATDLDGSAGLYRLKEELTRRVNAAIAPNRVSAVLFKEIVVQ